MVRFTILRIALQSRTRRSMSEYYVTPSKLCKLIHYLVTLHCVLSWGSRVCGAAFVWESTYICHEDKPTSYKMTFRFCLQTARVSLVFCYFSNYILFQSEGPILCCPANVPLIGDFLLRFQVFRFIWIFVLCLCPVYFPTLGTSITPPPFGGICILICRLNGLRFYVKTVMSRTKICHMFCNVLFQHSLG